MNKKQELYELLKTYVDKDNCIDIDAFRKDHPREYRLLNYHFGGVSKMAEFFGWIKLSGTKKTEQQVPLATVRDRLAYEKLTELRRNSSLEKIGQTYGVSRAAINQLHTALKKVCENITADK